MNDKKKLDMDVIAHTVARFLTIVTRGGCSKWVFIPLPSV